jgi:hypothetical protein
MELTERFDAAKIHSTEAFWRDHQPWLQSAGYMLRPRYRPGWKASWLATVDGKEVKIKRAIECEDSRTLMVSVIPPKMFQPSKLNNDSLYVTSYHQLFVMQNAYRMV